MAGDILQAFQSATQLGNAILQQKNYLNTQIAEEEIRNIQLDFNDKLNATMADLSQRGDWNNFDETIEDFYAQYRNTAEGMVSSPYASRIVGNFLDQNYQDTKWKVNAMQLQAQKNAIVQNASKTLEQLATSNVDMQYAASMGVDSLNGCLANGAMDPQAYTQNAVTFIASALTTKAETTGSELIRNGASWEQVEKAAKGVLDAEYDFRIVDTNSFSVYEDTDEYGNKVNRIDPTSGTVDANGLVDRKKITESTLKNLKVKWETKRRETQEYNDNRMEELYVQIAMGSDGDFSKNLANAKSYLSQMNADTLPDKRLKYWADTLSSVENKASSNETTPRGNSAVKVETASNILKDNMQLFLNQLVMGTGDYDNIYAAQKAFTIISYSDYVDQMKSAGYDMNEYSYTDFINEGAEIVNSFTKEAVKAGYVPKEVGVEMENTNKLFDEYFSNLAGIKPDKNGKYSEKEVVDALSNAGINYEDEMTKVRTLYWDIVKETDWNSPDAVKNAHDRMKNLVGTIYVARVDNKNAYKIERKWGESETRSIARVANALEKDEAAYTINDSDALWSGKRNAGYAYGVEAERENNTLVFSAAITKAVGDNVDLVARDEYSATDVSANPVFTDRNTGDEYKVMSEDGETYSIVKRSKGSKDWETVTTVGNEGIKKEDVVGGNAMQFQIEQTLNGKNDTGPTEQQIKNAKTSEVVNALDKRGEVPYFYDAFFKKNKLNFLAPKNEANFKDWWNETTQQKKQQYMEWLRDNYPGRYESTLKNLPEVFLADMMGK
ncbi:MAG: hypothetical protein MJZ25_13010 [Fibrobacter sp.]|nr:hypothetical protein [Fibrobacter sp.]